MSFIRALEEEIEQIKKELRADPRFIKWLELKRIHSLYVDQPQAPRSAERNQESEASSIRGRRPDPERTRLLETAIEYVMERRAPVPTYKIYDMLRAKHFDIPGEKPVNNLSAILSNSGLFRANGRSGWTLKSETETGDGDQPADAREDGILSDVGSEYAEQHEDAAEVDPLS